MERKQRYQHGGSPQKDLVRLNLPDAPVLDFSVNLNPFGVPQIIRDRWAELLDAVENYPSVEGDGIAQYYHETCRMPLANILAGNGSTEMIYLVPRALGFKHVLIFTPSYHDYERASLLAGATVERFRLSRENHFSAIDETELVDALQNADALWIGRPNNPTGSLLPRDDILLLADRFPDKWFIIDEAFIQFLEDWETESLGFSQTRPNILVIHSLTKFYAIAGLRMGGVVGSEAVISRLRDAKEPWSVNGIADRIALFLPACTDYEHESRLAVAKERERIFNLLQGLDGIVAFPSSTNFLLCQWIRSRNLDDLIQYLLKNGAYVRDCRNFPGLNDNFFRIGLRSAHENDRLFSLLASFPRQTA